MIYLMYQFCFSAWVIMGALFVFDLIFGPTVRDWLGTHHNFAVAAGIVIFLNLALTTFLLLFWVWS